MINESKMKNIIVLKDLPSNIVDEAIVILKNNVKVKNKEKIENKIVNKGQEEIIENCDFAVKEAELIIQNYIKEIEEPKEIKKTNVKYKKLQISSFFLAMTIIIGIIISIIK